MREFTGASRFSRFCRFHAVHALMHGRAAQPHAATVPEPPHREWFVTEEIESGCFLISLSQPFSISAEDWPSWHLSSHTHQFRPCFCVCVRAHFRLELSRVAVVCLVELPIDFLLSVLHRQQNNEKTQTYEKTDILHQDDLHMKQLWFLRGEPASAVLTLG